jgi:hypothetical protein
VSYDDELFPGMTPPFSATWVDRRYCFACRGMMAEVGQPLDGTYVEFEDKQGKHRHYVRVQDVKGGSR